jgi:DNA-binding response OmpR family regulator
MLGLSERHRVPVQAAPFSDSREVTNAPRALRVLIADDDHDMVLTLMMLLRDDGYDVRGLHSGRPVMAAVIEFNPDVVVLDINMPGVDGWQLASTIRARSGKKPPCLIGMSGVFTNDVDKKVALRNGFDHYLVKPCAPADLLRLLAPLRSERS